MRISTAIPPHIAQALADQLATHALLLNGVIQPVARWYGYRAPVRVTEQQLHRRKYRPCRRIAPQPTETSNRPAQAQHRLVAPAAAVQRPRRRRQRSGTAGSPRNRAAAQRVVDEGPGRGVVDFSGGQRDEAGQRRCRRYSGLQRTQLLVEQHQSPAAA